MIIDRNSPIPNYFQLQNWLREQIEQGVFKPGDRVPTEEELSRVTGLARATIRQAIQNLVNMGLLVRKRRLGTFVLEKVATARNNTIIGLLIPDIRRGYAPVLARGVQDEAAKSKHSLILCDTDDLFVRADFHADRMIENSVGGVIFVPTAVSDEQNQKILDKFQRNNIPVVLVDRTLPSNDWDYVTADNITGAYEMTEYLIKRGHRRIAITLSTLISTECDRLEGYRRAFRDHGLPVDEKLIFAHSGPFAEGRYIQIAEKIFKSDLNVTAVFAGHDRIALVFFAVAKKLGISIPEDISVVGYDDLNFTTVALTTIHQPIYEMGQESLKLIMSRINGDLSEPQRIVLKSYLVERSSVRSI
ncbi:MAG: GntR family transcriptional regulator [Candidatus Neomarinimicrobiota bacterium]